MEEIAVKRSMFEATPEQADYQGLLHDLGFIRGWAWSKKIPDAVSEALERVIANCTESLPATEIVFSRPKPIEPPDKMISDDTRHELKTWYGLHPHVEGIAGAAAIDEDIVKRVVAPIRNKAAEAQIERDNAAIGEVESPAPVTDASRPEQAGATDHVETGTPAILAQPQSDSSTGWTPEQKRLLREMKLSGNDTWRQIGEKLGKKPNQCSSMWHWEKKKIETDPSAHERTEGTESAATIKASEFTPIAESPKVSLARPTPLVEPPLPHRLTLSHPDWAGRREDNQLHDSDWPDIREMLARGKSRLTIASDFDVEPESLDAFIKERESSRGKPGRRLPERWPARR